MKSLLLVFSIPFLIFLISPVNSYAAHASIRQDSCVYYWEGDVLYLRIHFTVINNSLGQAIDCIRLIPTAQPVPPECDIVSCEPPAGWSCYTTGDGGAHWWGSGPPIEPGEMMEGFSFVLDPGECCYYVRYYVHDPVDPPGLLVYECEACFCKKEVPTDQRSWGHIKSLYR